MTRRLPSVVVALALAVSACGGSDEPEQVGPPRIRDEAYANVFQRVYEANPNPEWWTRIDDVTIRLGTIRIETDYSAASTDDLINAALLCTAIVQEINPSGVSAGVRVEGTLQRARRLVDGSIEARIDDDWVLTSGSTESRRDPDRCVAKALLPNTHEEFEARGWVNESELLARKEGTYQSKYSTDERREMRQTMNFFDDGNSYRSEQLSDGTWAYFGN